MRVLPGMRDAARLLAGPERGAGNSPTSTRLPAPAPPVSPVPEVRDPSSSAPVVHLHSTPNTGWAGQEVTSWPLRSVS